MSFCSTLTVSSRIPMRFPPAIGNSLRIPSLHPPLRQGPVPMCAPQANSTDAHQSGSGSWGAVTPQNVLQPMALEALYLHLLRGRGSSPPWSHKCNVLLLPQPSLVTPSAPLASIPTSVPMVPNLCLLRSPSCVPGRGFYCSLHILHASHTSPRFSMS